MRARRRGWVRARRRGWVRARRRGWVRARRARTRVSGNNHHRPLNVVARMHHMPHAHSYAPAPALPLAARAGTGAVPLPPHTHTATRILLSPCAVSAVSHTAARPRAHARPPALCRCTWWHSTGGALARERPARASQGGTKASTPRVLYQMRPYYLERTGSHPNSEVKQGQAQVVLRWGTTREGWVLHLFCARGRCGVVWCVLRWGATHTGRLGAAASFLYVPRVMCLCTRERWVLLHLLPVCVSEGVRRVR